MDMSDMFIATVPLPFHFTVTDSSYQKSISICNSYTRTSFFIRQHLSLPI